MIQTFDTAGDGFGSGHKELVLVGPPGTGKTRCMLDSFLVPALQTRRSHEVLACSFTKAAAKELRQRVASHVDLGERDLRRVCSTIHSEAFHLGAQGCSIWRDSKKPGKRATAATLLGDDEDQDLEITGGWAALQEPCGDLRKEMHRLWGLGRNLVVNVPESPDEKTVRTCLFAALDRTETRHPVDALIAETIDFEGQKRALGQVDFTDMLLRALRDGTTQRRALLIVDEAQDLSPLQIALVRLWATNADQFVLAGDPDQGIFSFAGADGLYLTNLIRSGSTARSLQQSYRVPVAPHALARRVITMNRDRIDSPYHPADRAGEVEVCRSVREAMWLAARLAVNGSVFVLARTCARLGEYATLLTEDGVPFVNERGSSPWAQKKLRTAMLAIIDLLEGQRASKERLREFVDELPGRPRSPLLAGKKKDAQAAVAALEDGSYVRPEEIGSLGLSYAALLDCEMLEGVLACIGKLPGVARPLMDMFDKFGLEALLREPTITLTTYHASKGREAKTVVVDTAAPYPVRRLAKAGDHAAMEGERRALYVAVTRAIDTVIVSRAENDLFDLLGVSI